LDSSGNIYVTGYSYATWGGTSPSPINAHAGDYDAFVAKLDSSGARLWNTFLGAAGFDYGEGITLDSSGNIYVTGYSYATWGTSPSPINAHAGGGSDAFVAKLNSSGIRLWNTFLGAAGDDYGKNITVDSSGNIYVTGYSNATWGTSPSPINAHAGDYDAFVAKLDSSGVQLWNTFLGAAGDDLGLGIALDSSVSVYVTGYSTATWGAPIKDYAGGRFDAFVAKIRVIDVTITSPSVPANTIVQGTQNHILYKLNLSGAVADTTLTGLTVQTAGSYQTSDIPYFKLRYSADANLDSGDATLSIRDSAASGSNISFSGLNQSITAGTTGYLFVTADIANTAVNNRTIGITATSLTNIALTETAKLGTVPLPAGVLQTISKPSASITSITSTTPNGTYKTGDSISIKLIFSEPLTLAGTLSVSLNTGGTITISSFNSSSSADGYYTVKAGDSGTLNATAITLISGTLRDSAGVDATDVLPAQNITSAKNIILDGILPNPPIISASTPTFSDSPKWTISSGGGGIGVFRYKLDNSGLETGATEITSSVPFDYTPPSALAQGFHTLYVQEKDSSDNWSAISSFSVQIFRIAPSVFGTPVTFTTTPTWTWAGLTGLGGTGHFRILLDSSDFSTGFILTDATTFTPSGALTQGLHTLYVQEQDTADIWSQTGSAGITIQGPAEAIYVSKNNLQIEEPEGSETFTIRLAIKPRADVRIEILSTNTNVCTVSPSYVTLTPDNWNSGVTVTVKDTPFNLVNTQGANIVFKSAVSDDAYFNGKSTNKVSVTVRGDAAFTVYSVIPSYGVVGKDLTVTILGAGFDENTKVFYKPEGGVEREATRFVYSTTIYLTVPAPSAPQKYTLRITDGQKNFEETVFIEQQADLDAIKRKKAIIVAGGGTGYSGDYLWSATRFCTDQANTALQFQGYTSSNITYLAAGSAKPEKDATVENFKKAVTEWGRQPYTGDAIDELLIYMTGHGGKEIFTLKGSSDTTLSTDELKLWLDALQSSSKMRVILIYDACQSGSFVEKLKNPLYERIILTSASNDQSALFADNGRLSFSETFWNSVVNSGMLYRSFNNAKGNMNGMGQFPEIEIPSKYTDPNLDLKIGLGLMTSASPIDIKTVCPDLILDCGKNFADIWVENIVPLNDVKIVSAKIRYDDHTLTPDMTVREFLLLPDAANFRYTGSFDGFFESGTYSVSISALTMNDKESERVYLKVRKLCPVKGDVDNSYIINLADAILALRVLSGIEATVELRTDVNGDSRIGLEEVVYILQTVAGLR